jgi:hypothetical protein
MNLRLSALPRALAAGLRYHRETRLSDKTSQMAQHSSNRRAVLIATIGVALVLVTALYFSDFDPDDPAPASLPKPKVVQNTNSRDPACIQPGAVCRLKNVQIISGVDWVPTATDIAADAEFRKVLQANDKDGLIELLKAGRLLDTKAGDGIRVLDISVWNGRTEARLTSGKHRGTKVWIVDKWVVK